nr:MAG TPA: hypothetical protein [Caudoviricetes sp.]
MRDIVAICEIFICKFFASFLHQNKAKSGLMRKTLSR